MSPSRRRFRSSYLGRAALLALAAITSPALNVGAQSAPLVERSGELPDGQPWQITVPAGWNGIVINDLDRIGSDERAAFLLSRGYAYTGTRRHPDRQSKWDPQAESNNMVKVLERFTAEFGRPRLAIQFGCSGGGSVALSVAEDHADVFQGAIALHASMPGTVSNMRLDLTFALKVLLDSADALPLLPDGASAAAAARLWAAVLERAAATPHGRARMALAGALAQYPAWGSASAAPTAPRSRDERAMEDALLRVVVDGARLAISTRPRYDAPAGPMSSNVGVDYTNFYRHADAAQRRTVERMYQTAGLSVDADLARINAAPRLAATPEADAYWGSRAHKGTIGIPVLQASNIGDAMTPAAGMVAYQAMVKRNGREHFYRQAFIDAPGHCTFNTTELGSLVATMVRRLEGGSWGDLTSPGRLNAAGRGVEGAASRFIAYGAGWSLPTVINRAQRPTAGLVGTWRIVRYCDRDSTGAMVEPLGPNPTGLFVYTPTGQLSIQAMRTPPAGPLAGEPVRLASLSELRPFYFGYFGTYSILSDTAVVHHVQGGTFPDYIGTDQPRKYLIRGDTLSIGQPMFLCRVLIRVK